MAPGKRGPGRASQPGKKGRTTRPTSTVGRYKDPVASGRVTPATPKGETSSPSWYGPAILALMILGVLIITLNYLNVLPGAVSAWYLISGLVLIFAGFFMATRYR